MAWYITGTISVTNGSATVTGSGTQFITGAQVGEGLLENGQLYEIQSIESATSLTLAKAYLGATQSGLSYEIVPTQSLVADLANNVSSLIGDFQSVVDNAGAGKFNDGTVASPGISFTQDQNNGLYRIGADNWGLVAGGTKIVDVSTTGIDVTGTATMDGLTVADGSTGEIQLGLGTALTTGSGTYDSTVRWNGSSGNLLFSQGAVEKMRIGNTGIDVTGTATMDGLAVVKNGNTGANTNTTGSGISLTHGASPEADQGLALRCTGPGFNGISGLAFSSQIIADTTSANALEMFTTASSPLILGTNATERMRISSSGAVGIGTDSPWETVSIPFNSKLSFGSSAYPLSISRASSGTLVTTIEDGYDASNTRIDFKMRAGSANEVIPLSLDSSGNVLVGTTSVNGVNGTTISNNANITLNTSTTSGGEYITFRVNGTQVGSITGSGTSTSYNTSSDYRLKEDWKPIENATETFMQLKPCNFAWKADGTRVDGFLAHELQEVIPSAATGEKDGMRTEEYEVTPAVYEDVVIPATEKVLDEEGNVITEAQDERTEQQLVSEAVMGQREVPDMQGIDQAKVVPLLTAALQEAITKIESLEARLSALEA